MKRCSLFLVIIFTLFFSKLANSQEYFENGKIKNQKPQVLINLQNGTLPIELNNPIGSKTTSVVSNGKIIQSETVCLNDDKLVIVEFTEAPVRIYRGQKNFNFANLNNSIELVKSQQSKFIIDLNRIINDLDLQKQNSSKPTDYTINFRYQIVINGLSLKTKPWVIDEIKKLGYVKAIHEVVEVKINDDISNKVIQADSVWANYGITGEGMLIAIIDTGIDSNHVSLNNGKVIGGYSFVSNSPNFFDDHGHGTHCAGIAAANGNGLTGVAPDASLLGVKVLNGAGSGSSDQIIAGIEYSVDPDGDPNTDDGADVISMSLGGWGYPEDAQSIAVNNAVANGVVCIVAAGNNGDFFTVGSPGCAKDALTVAATDNEDNIATFSSRGPVANSDLIKPDIAAPGVKIYSAAPYNNYVTMSGTSMSTPHVAGAAALLRQKYPDWTPYQIKSALMGTSVDVGAAIWAQGVGRMNIYKATQTKSILIPSSINFGNIELLDSNWTNCDTLTLYNKSSITQKYKLSLDYNFPSGFSYEILPDSIDIKPDSSAQIILKVYVKDKNFAIPNVFPPTYKGKIIAKSNDDEIRSEFIFSKARLLNINLSQKANWIFIMDTKNANNFYMTFQNKTSVSVPVTLDTFDIVAYFVQPSDKYYHSTIDYYYVKEKFIVDKDTTYNLNISKDDCKNKIKFNYLDNNNNSTDYLNLGVWYFKLKINRLLLFYGVISNEFYVNDVSSNYQLGVGSMGLVNTELNIYDKFITMYKSKNGINQSEIYNIKSNNSFEINYNYYNFNDLNRKITADCFNMTPMLSMMFPYIEKDYLDYYNLQFNLRYDKQNIKKTYYNFINTESFDYSTQYQEEFNTKAVQLSPLMKINDNKVHFLTNDLLDTLKEFDYGSNFLNINNYQFFKGSITLENNYFKIKRPKTFTTFNKPGVFNNGYGFSLQKPIKFKLTNQNNLIIDTLIDNSLINSFFASFDNDLFFEKSNLPLGFNTIELKYDSLKFYNIYGFSKTTIGFNSISSNSGFPQLKSLFISNNDSIKEIYKPNDIITIRCKLLDLLESDTLRIYYCELNSTEWIQLSHNYSNGYYFADVDNTELFNYYSIKISITRNNNEFIIQELEPAFYIGLTAPILISPAIDTKNPPLFNLSWEQVPFAEKYLIQIAKDTNFTSIILNDTISSNVYSLLDSLPFWSKYYWRVKAITNNISSRWSEIRRFYTITDPSIQSYDFSSWGMNTYGQLGDSTTNDIYTPIKNSKVDDWNTLKCGYYHNLGIKSDGTLWSWGSNYYSQLGYSLESQINFPIQVGSDFDWKSISCGFIHSVGIKNTGHIWAWGNSSRGQVGDSSNSYRVFPKQIGKDTNWRTVSCGQYYTLAIKTDGTLWAWGANDNGQLGDGTTIDKTYPVQIGTDNNWKEIACASYYSTGIKTDGTLWGWGDNTSKQFPDERLIVNNPIQIGIDTNWKNVSCGYAYTIGLRNNGTLWGFGQNYSGQIGDSTYEFRNTPVQIGNDTNWISISCGGDQSKGIKSDASLWSWGANEYGQLGNGTTLKKNFPVRIGSRLKWKSIACGSYHNLGLFYLVPQLLSPINDTLNLKTNFTFKWEMFQNATKYKFQLSTSINFDTLIVNENDFLDTTYSVTGLDKFKKYYWRVKAYKSNDSTEWSDVWNFTTEPNKLILPLKQGWNMISSYIIPSADSVKIIMDSVKSNIVIMKNGAGQSYIPNYDIDNIGLWNIRHGYQIYAKSNDTLEITGTIVTPSDYPIYLNQGWSLISFLRNSQMPIESSMASITDSNRLVLAKNGSGKVFLPAYNINQIGNMIPGEGYQVYLSTKDTLIYPMNSLGKKSFSTIEDLSSKYLQANMSNTGSDATLIVNINAKDGDEIGVYNQNNELVGSGVVKNSISVFSIWGDNIQTEITDGALENEKLSLKLYNSEKNKLQEIELQKIVSLTNKKELSSLPYKRNAIYQAKGYAEVLDESISIDINPNPAMDNIEIKFNLPECEGSSLKLFTLSGNLVCDMSDLLQTNNHIINYNIDNITSGDYNLILTCGETTLIKKLVVLR